MKIGVAQIPVTMDAKINYETIVKACDWAVANGVDYLMTPEASVSGYDAPSFTVNTCQDTEDAVKKLQEYCNKNSLGLILGTLWLDEKDVRGKDCRISFMKKVVSEWEENNERT